MIRPRRFLLALLALALLTPPVAQAKTKKVPLIKLQGGTTTIVPDPGFASALGGLDVTASTLPPAATTDAGWVFPIVTGTLAGRKAAAGEIRHFGGLRLNAADGTHVDLNNLRIDDGAKLAVVTAQVGDGARIKLAALDISDATFKVTRRRFVLAGAGLLLSPAAAEALNAQFATSAFSAGQRMGTATVDAKIKLKLKTFET